jgi:hypothetical protein
MDFSRTDIQQTVSGLEEFQQTLYIMLLNRVRDFCQDPLLGATFSPHVADSALVDEGIRATLGKIKGLVVKSVSHQENEWEVSVQYQGRFINYKFDIQ